jgi:hypothetical protein
MAMKKKSTFTTLFPQLHNICPSQDIKSVSGVYGQRVYMSIVSEWIRFNANRIE